MKTANDLLDQRDNARHEAYERRRALPNPVLHPHQRPEPEPMTNEYDTPDDYEIRDADDEALLDAIHDSVEHLGDCYMHLPKEATKKRLDMLGIALDCFPDYRRAAVRDKDTHRYDYVHPRERAIEILERVAAAMEMDDAAETLVSRLDELHFLLSGDHLVMQTLAGEHDYRHGLSVFEHGKKIRTCVDQINRLDPNTSSVTTREMLNHAAAVLKKIDKYVEESKNVSE